MPQPHSPSAPKANFGFQPPCPLCGQPMWLMRLSSVDSESDLRTFDCQVCDHTETNIVKR
jgi:hypothetical protein